MTTQTIETIDKCHLDMSMFLNKPTHRMITPPRVSIPAKKQYAPISVSLLGTLAIPLSTPNYSSKIRSKVKVPVKTPGFYPLIILGSSLKNRISQSLTSSHGPVALGLIYHPAFNPVSSIQTQHSSIQHPSIQNQASNPESRIQHLLRILKHSHKHS